MVGVGYLEAVGVIGELRVTSGRRSMIPRGLWPLSIEF